MKKLITLILIIAMLPMFGQTYAYTITLTGDTIHHLVNSIIRIEDNIWGGGVTVVTVDKATINGSEVITINDLIEYEKYCFNDSVVEYEYKIVYWNGVNFDTIYSKTIKNYPECYIYQIPKTYSHKDPTFIGFVQWLKTKK